MSRYIDADALIKSIESVSDGEDALFNEIANSAIRVINTAKTIEPCEDAISREDAIKALIETPREEVEFDKGTGVIRELPSVAPSRRGGDWIDLFEEIGNTIDTIGDGQETEAFNRGIEACAEIVRRFFGLDMSKESGR